MMYPFLKLDDETEIVHSEMLPDGQVKVYMEQPVDGGFNSATCMLPSYVWSDIEGYTPEQIDRYREVIESTSHLILKYATTGGYPDSVTSIGGNAFRWCGKLKSVTIPKGVKSIGGEAFYDCGGLTSITMCGERPEAPNNVFKGCRNLKSIHVPANAKSWAGMKEWQGIPLVFDAK